LNRFLTLAKSAQATVTQDALILRLGLGLGMTRTSPRPIEGRKPTHPSGSGAPGS
jgi:hypothetical protein